MPHLHVHERLLQLIWEKQYVRPERLVTTDGLRVVVLEPGRVSLDSGPDIREARVRIGGVLFAGDIEIHRTAREWDAHGHALDPRYNRVILHVVLHPSDPAYTASTLGGRALPVLPLDRALERPLEELRTDLLFDERDLLAGRLHCSGQNSHVPAGVIDTWLERLSAERMEIKLRRFEERIRELARAQSRSVREPEQGKGVPNPYTEPTALELSRSDIWEQVLYEGLMEGLGYSRNRRPFIELSRNLPLDLVRRLASDAVQTESLLFGVSGLLPDLAAASDAESRTYLHILRNEWNAQSREYRGVLLSEADWVIAPSRPSNSPYVRLVAARSLTRRLLDEDLFRECVSAVKRTGPDARNALHHCLSVDPGPFWERRSSFSRVIPRRLQPLGEQRKDDLIVNILAPFFLLYARLFRDGKMRDAIVQLLTTYPPSQDNSITRRLRSHLLDGKVRLNSALRQQGALQLYHYYCKEGRCMECEVGMRVWG